MLFCTAMLVLFGAVVVGYSPSIDSVDVVDTSWLVDVEFESGPPPPSSSSDKSCASASEPSPWIASPFSVVGFAVG